MHPVVMAKNRTHTAQKATTAFSPARTVSQLQPKGFGLPQTATQEPVSFNASQISLFPSIQAKLTVGAPNDKYEQEADAVAAKVVERINSPQPPQPPPNPSRAGAVQRQAALEEELQQKPLAESIQRQTAAEDEELQQKPLAAEIRRQAAPEEEAALQQKPLAENIQRQDVPQDEELQQKPASELQRSAPEPEEEEALQAKPDIQRQAIAEEETLQQQPLQRKGDAAMAAPMPVESSIAGARGQGQGLDNGTRGKMEGAFGTDFSSVRVHTDERADGLNRSLQSRAFATGKDIFFKSGEFNPGSRGGQELLAHELTHVVQQNSQRDKGIQLKRNSKQSKPGEVYASFLPTYSQPAPPTLLDGQWYSVDRQINPTVPGRSFWKAAMYNTKNRNYWAYRSIAQRHAFYKFADAYLNTVSKATKSQWFAAAAIVTGRRAVGAADKDTINLWYLSDNTEEFLRAGNKFLFQCNMKNFSYLMEGKDIPNLKLKGLKGKKLDSALVEFEQSKVGEFIKSYKGKGMLKDMIKQINSSFDATLAPSEIKEVIKKNFSNKGIKFDFAKYDHRVLLGKKMVSNLYKKRKIK